MKKQEKKLKERITVTVDRDVYEALKFEVGNASAFANDAIKRHIALQKMIEKSKKLNLVNLEI